MLMQTAFNGCNYKIHIAVSVSVLNVSQIVSYIPVSEVQICKAPTDPVHYRAPDTVLIALFLEHSVEEGCILINGA